MLDQINPVPPPPVVPPPARVELAEGYLACRHCGVAVRMPTDDGDGGGYRPRRETVTRLSAIASGNPAARRLPPNEHRIDFTTCRSCSERWERAEAMAERLPELAGVVGNRVAVHVGLALDLVAAVGATLPPVETMTLAEAATMVRQLARHGARVQYDETGDEGHAAGAPWRHVTRDTYDDLRAVYGAFLARRVALKAPPKTIECPDGGACLFCGVGSLLVAAVTVHDLGGLAEATARLWTPTRASRAALAPHGAHDGGAGTVAGRLCPECAAAVSETGAIGPEAMAVAYMRHLRASGADMSQLWGWNAPGATLDGVDAWVATSPARPNREPWEHIDLDGVTVL